MEVARSIALQGETRKYRMSALLVQNKKIVSTGVNKPGKTHTISQGTKYNTLHAEMDCIIGVPRDTLANASLYVFRHSWTNERNFSAISKPCQHCESIIKHAGIREVFYINRAGQIERMRL
jgi:deoxycytidylate deaminase